MTSETWLPTVPIEIWVSYSQHRCSKCKRYFNADLTDLADPRLSLYPSGLFHLAVRLVVEDGPAVPPGIMALVARPQSFLSLGLQFKTGLRRRGKKAEQRITTEYLDGVLADFSGYIAADELYDGPFCVLSIVDNHTFKRLIYEVLDHNPTHEDITNFSFRFRTELVQRTLTLRGVTTDGSPLYPEPLALIFP